HMVRKMIQMAESQIANNGTLK
ncbi:small acid-soluble spore protein, partial [Thermoanaerobacterium thermosaccharolyticum]|nr:small acid-soluble spore protein [Thermoanaerobacterium thermosaccharolyticum]MBE0227563.1 small acid-soluble spore protein [Thermoanaerobacterium thermosaccharolyticum]